MKGTKYELVRQIATDYNWNLMETKKKMPYTLKWYDFYINEDELKRMLPFQRINHFPCSASQQLNISLGKKNNLGKHLKKLQKIYPNDYNFFPKTWLLPYQYEDLKSFYLDKEIKKQQKIFIAKPEASSQGKGIFLFRQIESIAANQHMIVQQYIQSPLLIGIIQQKDGLKFDVRLYVLIKNIDPLKIFLYKDGIARLATEKYQIPQKSNIDNLYIHLTNYALNKNNAPFKQNCYLNGKEQGHKRTFSSVLKEIKQKGGDVDLLMDQIRQLIVKTICAVQPIINHAYKSSRPNNEQLELCFEILGFDIMIDSDLKPWLIEINHTPSFKTDSNLDLLIKKNCLIDTLLILDLKSKDFQIYKEYSKSMPLSAISKQIMYQCDRFLDRVEDYENKNLNGFMRCYPIYQNNQYMELYRSFMEMSKKLWNHWSSPNKLKNQFQIPAIISPNTKKIRKKCNLSQCTEIQKIKLDDDQNQGQDDNKIKQTIKTHVDRNIQEQRFNSQIVNEIELASIKSQVSQLNDSLKLVNKSVQFKNDSLDQNNPIMGKTQKLNEFLKNLVISQNLVQKIDNSKQQNLQNNQQKYLDKQFLTSSANITNLPKLKVQTQSYLQITKTLKQNTNFKLEKINFLQKNDVDLSVQGSQLPNKSQYEE